MKVTKRDINGRVETAESKNLIWIANPRKDIGWEVRKKGTNKVIFQELRGFYGSDSTMVGAEGVAFEDEQWKLRRFVSKISQ